MIGENYVSVPTHFFKVVVGEMENSSLELEAYVLPNQVSSNFMLTNQSKSLKHTEAAVLKKLSLAGLAKLSRLRYS